MPDNGEKVVSRPTFHIDPKALVDVHNLTLNLTIVEPLPFVQMLRDIPGEHWQAFLQLVREEAQKRAH